MSGTSGSVQGSEEPFAAAIASEYASRAVGPVSRRGQADDEHLRVRIAESRYRPPPVLLIGVRRSALPRHLLAPAHQSRTCAARDDRVIELGEIG